MSLHNVGDWGGVKAIVITVSSKDSVCGGGEWQKPHFADSGVVILFALIHASNSHAVIAFQKDERVFHGVQRYPLV